MIEKIELHSRFEVLKSFKNKKGELIPKGTILICVYQKNDVFKFVSSNDIELNLSLSLINKVVQEGKFFITNKPFPKDISNLAKKQTAVAVLERPAPKKWAKPGTDVFPQANDFDVLIKLMKAMKVEKKGFTKDDVAVVIEQDERQGDYYAQAGQYLNLLTKKGKHFHLTADCKEILHLPPNEMNRKFADRILEFPAFAIFYKYKRDYKKFPSNKEMILQLKERNLLEKDLADKTLLRRITNIKSWVEWAEKAKRIKN